jgi:uncharacterized protein (TIGR03437 family)
MILRCTLLALAILALPAFAQTQLTLGVPAPVILPATNTETLYSFAQGFRVNVPPTASRLIVKFEEPYSDIFTGVTLIVRPRVDVSVNATNLDPITSDFGGPIKIVAYPLDYARADSTYQIGFRAGRRSTPIVGIITATVETLPADGQTVSIPHTAQIMLAGEPAGRTFGPFSLPTHACPSIVIKGGQSYRILADGGITYSATSGTTTATSFLPPSGSPNIDQVQFLSHPTGSASTLSSIRAPRAALVGVFRGAQGQRPASGLDYANGAYNSLIRRPDRHIGEVDISPVRPALDQPFYIGSGIDSKSREMTFIAPAGATQLYFGVLESALNLTYTGNIRAVVSEVATPALPPQSYVEVPVTASIHLADAPAYSALTLADAVFSEVLSKPVELAGPFREGDLLRFRASGFISTSDPNGSSIRQLSMAPQTNIGSSIAAITAPAYSLIGVFLGDSLNPSLRPDPVNIPRTPPADTINPQLQQPFFIGTGVVPFDQFRSYRVPAGARRLFVGVARAGLDARTLVTGSYKLTYGLAGTNAPAVNGVVSGAAFLPGLAPGQIASIFGSNFAPTEIASIVPLPRDLAGLSVQLDEFSAPIYFVSPGQINIQVPWELAGRSGALLTVRYRGSVSAPFQVPLFPFLTTVFTANGRPVIVNSATNTLYSATSPARRGETITIYSSGQGPVLPVVETGAAAPLDSLRNSVFPLRVRFGAGSQQVVVNALFSGLAPGFVGVYQINATIPSNAPVGETVISIDSPANPNAATFPFTIAP